MHNAYAVSTIAVKVVTKKRQFAFFCICSC